MSVLDLRSALRTYTRCIGRQIISTVDAQPIPSPTIPSQPPVQNHASGNQGRTRQLNFFHLARRLALVDLPGYGYARASKSDVKAWTALVFEYLRGRIALRRVCILIDARRGIGEADRKVLAALDLAAVSYAVILTKADKVPAGALDETIEATLGELAKRPAAHPAILVTSATKGDGIADLRAWLAPLAEDG